MKLFECQNCGQLLYFENTQCEKCGHELGYLPQQAALSALEPDGKGRYRPLADGPRQYVYCRNKEHGACNWLVSPDDPAGLCMACRLNRTIPDLGIPQNAGPWLRLQGAKHRLVYGLKRLRLPLISKTDDPEKGLAFDFLAGPAAPQAEGHVVTGHANGVVTIDIAEADDARREQMRQKMGERYRTLLGHLRHEVAHYYWDRLIAGGENLTPFRKLFGDERQDYEQALQAHYANGAPAGWPAGHISSYASAHPWEDWAETFAHYLHVLDTTETAYAFGLRVRPRVGNGKSLAANVSFDPYGENDFEKIIDAWLPVVFAVNSLNRSMGQSDFYPFVMPAQVVEKLNFIHRVVREQKGGKPLGQRVRHFFGWSK